MRRLIFLTGLLLLATAAHSETEYTSAYDPAFVRRVATLSPLKYAAFPLHFDVSCSTAFNACNASGGASTTGTNAWTGANSFVDGSFSILGSADATKIAKFEVDGFTTANTRIFTLPGLTGNDTVATLAAANIFTSSNQFNSGVLFSRTGNIGPQLVTGTYFGLDTGALILFGVVPTLTPDAPVFGTSTVSNSLHIAERDDIAYDANNGPCGTAVCARPTLIVRNSTQDVTQYSAHSAAGIMGKMVKALTESAATAVVDIPIAASLGTGGKIIYTVFSEDAVDQQIRTGMVTYAGVNKATVMTCAINGVDALFTANPTELLDGSAAGAMSAGTLTYAWTASAVAVANRCQFLLNAVSSLTQTTLVIQYQVIQTGPGEVLPQ